jgi:hypothetical protein
VAVDAAPRAWAKMRRQPAEAPAVVTG